MELSLALVKRCKVLRFQSGNICSTEANTVLSKEPELLRRGGNNTTVNVKTKVEADALLKEAFQD